MKSSLCVTAALTLALLLPACSQSSSPPATPEPTASALQAADAAVRAFAIEGLLPPETDATFELVGQIYGYGAGGEGSGEDLRLDRIYLSVPFRVDGVRADVEFALRVTDASKIRDASGDEVPRSRQEEFLFRDVSAWGAVVRRLASGKLLTVELRALADSDGEGPESAPSARPPVGPPIRLLRSKGVLPQGDDGTLDVIGRIDRSQGTSAGGSGPIRPRLVDLDVPAVIDGVEVDVRLALTVNDRSKVFDSSGRETPRADHYESIISEDAAAWRATVRRSEQDRLVVVEMRPAAGR